jgi:acetyltransferase-like isoleucine patch superfamily enzyme
VVADLPPNAEVGDNTVVLGDIAFLHFKSTEPKALVIGDNCTMAGVHFNLGHHGTVTIGDHCYFTDALLLAEGDLTIGSYVMIGWNAVIADCDFHPMAPSDRIADAVAVSPLGRAPRPRLTPVPVCIEDDVWIGPGATILKGVSIGAGAVVHAGSVVTSDVPAASAVLGNPARVVEFGL